MKKQLISITESRYHELSMLELKNQMLQRDLNELHKQLLEKKEYIDQLEEYISKIPNRNVEGMKYQKLKKEYNNKIK